MSLWRRIFLERRAVVLPLAVLIVGNLAVLGLVVFPLEQSVSSAAQRVDDSKHDLAMAQALLTSAKAQRASKEQAERELKTFYEQILPTNEQEATKLTDFAVEQIARQSGIIKKNGQNGWDASKDSRLIRMTSRVTLVGDYNGIRRFLFALESARPFVVVERVELAESNTEQANSGPQNAGNTLEVSLSLASYYLAQQ